MIDVKELRIGNLLLCDRNRIVEFHGVTEGHCKLVLNYKNGSGIYYNEIDSVKPIPLTEEWLIKFGFNSACMNIGVDNASYYHINNFRINIIREFISGIILDLELDRFSQVSIYSVHQLQNLYFALTGEELELKEDSK